MSNLTERQRLVLALVIRDYIETAQPVSSLHLVDHYGLDKSPATVRNEMMALEYAGLLSQPHASAGRVPTVLGYRYFVQHLMPRQDLPEGIRQAIRRQLRQAGRDANRRLRLSAAIVAHTSGAAGLVASPMQDDSPRLFHAGLTEILDEPEFADGQCLRVVVEILEYGTGLRPLIELLPSHGVEVIIGGEPPLESVPHVTMILSRFGGGEPFELGVAHHPLGRIGAHPDDLRPRHSRPPSRPPRMISKTMPTLAPCFQPTLSTARFRADL